MKKLTILFFAGAVIVLVIALINSSRKLQGAPSSPERRKYLADQYKRQLDGIFSQAAAERRELTSAEQVEADRLQEKLIQLGYVYELPGELPNGGHIFMPSSWAFQPFLN